MEIPGKSEQAQQPQEEGHGLQGQGKKRRARAEGHMYIIVPTEQS